LENLNLHENNIIIAPTCFGFRSSSGSLYRDWLKLHLLKHSVKLRLCTLCGDVAACREMACVLFVVQTDMCIFM